jgi:hypothetical protein
LLVDEDEIQFPGRDGEHVASAGTAEDCRLCTPNWRGRYSRSDTIWRYRQNIVHHGQECGLSSVTHKDLPHPLFKSAKASLIHHLAGYRVHNIILGDGGFSTVYLASYNECQVAIKTVSPAPYNQVRATTSKLGEVAAMKRVSHRNVQAVLDTFKTKTSKGETIDAVVLELVTGGDVFSYVARFGSLTESEVRFFTYQVLLGLQALHEAGLAHRGRSAARSYCAKARHQAREPPSLHHVLLSPYRHRRSRRCCGRHLDATSRPIGPQDLQARL